MCPAWNLSATRRPHSQETFETVLQQQAEFLERLFDQVPLLVNITGPDGLIRYVNPRWEKAIGWTRKEIVDQKLDVLAACYPNSEQRRDVLAFIEAAREQWRGFRHLVRDGREIHTTWIEMRLPDGMVVGLGVDSSRRQEAQEALQDNRQVLGGPLFDLATASAYLRRLFMPPCPVDSNLILTSVEPRGADLALFLRLRAERRTMALTVPKVLVDLSARHGSADLLIRLIHDKTGSTGDSLESPKSKGAVLE